MKPIFYFINEGKYTKIILIGITIIIISLILKKIFNRSDNTTTQHKIQNKYTLADLKSNDDLEFKVNTYQRNLQKEVSRSIQIIQEEKNKGLIKKSTVWMNHFQEYTDLLNKLDKNLQYENSRRLNEDKFHKYTNLHFRSHISGIFAYECYIEAKSTRDEIGQILVNIGKKKIRVTPAEKKQLYETKDICVKTTRYLYKQMIAIENDTGKFRDKIRDECGSKGRSWYDRLQRNKNMVKKIRSMY